MLDGTNYFVSTTGNDANNGLTPATAWRTVWRATDNSSLLPGDTINVLAGVYTHDGVDTLVNGTAAAPITVKADGGPVTIQGGVLSNAWTLYNAAANVYALNFDQTGLVGYYPFCTYANTAYGYGAMTNLGSTFFGHLPDPDGNYNFNSDPASPAELLSPPTELVNQCYCFWSGYLGGNPGGTTMYLHAPPGWTQQEVSANVIIGDASKSIIVNNSYWTFENLNVAGSYDGFNISANNITIANCSIEDIYNQPCFGGGNNLTFENNLVESIGQQYTPTPSTSPAITVSDPAGQDESLLLTHVADGDLDVYLYSNGATVGEYDIPSSMTVSDLGQFLQGLGLSVSVVGNGGVSSQFMIETQAIDLSQPETFQAASWSLQYPLGSYYHGIYFGGDNALIANSIFTNINGNGISFRYGNNITIENNLIDNDLGGLINVGGSNITVFNNVFHSTSGSGNGVNIAYGGNGGTLEFEQNTVSLENWTGYGFVETAAGTNSTNWIVSDNIFAAVVPADSTPLEVDISTTSSADLANWELYDNIYWVGDANGNAVPFKVFMAVAENGYVSNRLYSTWSDYYNATNDMWGWEQGSLDVNPELDANYLPDNPTVIAVGAGAVLDGTVGPTSATVDSGTQSIAGPLILTGNTDMIVTNESDQLAISGPISGSGQLVKYGNGSLVLSGTNTYSGGTIVSSGTLILNSAAALAAGSSLTIGQGNLGTTPSDSATGGVGDGSPKPSLSAVAAPVRGAWLVAGGSSPATHHSPPEASASAVPTTISNGVLATVRGAWLLAGGSSPATHPPPKDTNASVALPSRTKNKDSENAALQAVFAAIAPVNGGVWDGQVDDSRYNKFAKNRLSAIDAWMLRNYGRRWR
jgi:autotransporter-associated beta strand protein